MRIKINLMQSALNKNQSTHWLYVDSNKIFLIKQLKKKIQNLFKESRDIHLCFKNVPFLDEDDIHAINENEEITVVVKEIDICSESKYFETDIQQLETSNIFSNSILPTENIESKFDKVHESSVLPFVQMSSEKRVYKSTSNKISCKWTRKKKKRPIKSVEPIQNNFVDINEDDRSSGLNESLHGQRKVFCDKTSLPVRIPLKTKVTISPVSARDQSYITKNSSGIISDTENGNIQYSGNNTTQEYDMLDDDMNEVDSSLGSKYFETDTEQFATNISSNSILPTENIGLKLNTVHESSVSSVVQVSNKKRVYKSTLKKKVSIGHEKQKNFVNIQPETSVTSFKEHRQIDFFKLKNGQNNEDDRSSGLNESLHGQRKVFCDKTSLPVRIPLKTIVPILPVVERNQAYIPKNSTRISSDTENENIQYSESNTTEKYDMLDVDMNEIDNSSGSKYVETDTKQLDSNISSNSILPTENIGLKLNTVHESSVSSVLPVSSKKIVYKSTIKKKSFNWTRKTKGIKWIRKKKKRQIKPVEPIENNFVNIQPETSVASFKEHSKVNFFKLKNGQNIEDVSSSISDKSLRGQREVVNCENSFLYKRKNKMPLKTMAPVFVRYCCTSKNPTGTIFDTENGNTQNSENNTSEEYAKLLVDWKNMNPNSVATTIKYPTIKKSGVSTWSRRMKILASNSKKKVKIIEQVLQSLELKLNPIPTKEVCQNYNALRNEILLFNDFEADYSSSYHELLTIKSQYEILNPNGALKIDPVFLEEIESLSVSEDGNDEETVDKEIDG